MRRFVPLVVAGVVVVLAPVAAFAGGQEEDDPTNTEPVTVPTTIPSSTPRTTATPPSTTSPGGTTLPTLPPECDPPKPADVVFVGSLTAAAGGVARFEVLAVRRDPGGHVAIGAPVDVRLRDDVRFLVVDENYLVAAAVGGDELVSKVVEPKSLFGGDQIVGLNDADPDCPAFVDPVVVRNGDGSSVDTAILGGFTDDKRGIALSFLLPAAAVIGALLALVLCKRFLIGIWIGMVRGARWLRRRLTPSVGDGGPLA